MRTQDNGERPRFAAGGAESRLRELGIELPAAPTPFGNYVETLQTGNLLFLTGMLPVVDHKPKYVGRLGKELNAEDGRDAAYTAALERSGSGKKHLGSLDRVTQVVRLGVFMATSRGLLRPAAGSRMARLTCFAMYLARRRMSVRMVIGVASLPLGMPIELEVIFEVAE